MVMIDEGGPKIKWHLIEFEYKYSVFALVELYQT